MKITAVEALPFSFWHDREPLSYCLVRITTDAGVTGWGEVCDSFGCTYATVVSTVIADAYSPLLVGEAFDSPDRVVHKLRSWTRRRLGPAWVATQALSGVEVALWDAAGKASGQSVAELLGGRPEAVRIYASSVFLEEGPADWHLELLQPLLQAGIRAAKLRIGTDWQSDLATLRTIRDRLDPGVDLMIDGNENYTVPTALEIAGRLADLGVCWFEEPVPQEYHSAVEAVVTKSPVPIAYGEHMFGLVEFADAIRRSRGSVLQPDATTCGGLSETMRIVDAARAAGTPVVPHTAAGPVALAANLHLAAASPYVKLVEYPYPLAECWASIAPSAPLGPDRVVEGALSPPPGPGLGVEVDLDAVLERPYQPPSPRSGSSSRFVGDI